MLEALALHVVQEWPGVRGYMVDALGFILWLMAMLAVLTALVGMVALIYGAAWPEIRTLFGLVDTGSTPAASESDHV